MARGLWPLLTHPLTHSLTHSLTHPLTHVRRYVSATTFMVLANLNKFVVIAFGIVVLREASMHTHAYACTRMHTHACTCTYMHTHAYMHAALTTHCMRTYMHTAGALAGHSHHTASCMHAYRRALGRPFLAASSHCREASCMRRRAQAERLSRSAVRSR